MFDAKTARKIQDAIAVHNRMIPTIPDIMVRMSLVPSIHSGSYPVYALQCGDLTILVVLYYDENGELLEVRAQFASW